MRNNGIIKKVFHEFLFILINFILGLLFFTIPFIYYTDYFNPRGFPLIFQILFVPFAVIYEIQKIKYLFIFLFFPYILFKTARYFLRKKLKNNLITICVLCSSLFFYFLIIPTLLDCQVNFSGSMTGYYNGNHSACYSLMTGFIDGGDHSVFQVKNADYKTFEAFKNNTSYAKDKNKVYYDYFKPVCNECIKATIDIERGISEADPMTFEVLTDGWTKDKNNVYHAGEKIAGADTETFIILNDKYARDKNFIYTWTIDEESMKYKIEKINIEAETKNATSTNE